MKMLSFVARSVSTAVRFHDHLNRAVELWLEPLSQNFICIKFKRLTLSTTFIRLTEHLINSINQICGTDSGTITGTEGTFHSRQIE